jgi:hypothetical protein
VVDGRTSPTDGIPPEFGTARPDDRSEIWQGFMDLPVGPCTIQLRARDNDGEVICTATEAFDIVADTTSKVNLVMICDTSFQAPVGSLDVDATFSFVVGNFCPDLFVLNCNAQDESVQVVDTPFGPQAPSLCEVRFRDVDSTCGQSCDPQSCDETPEGLDCTPGPDNGVTTTVTCEASPPGSAALDCDLNGVPDAECVFNGDTLGSVGAPPSGPLAPADGGFAVGFALCTQGIVDGTDPGCGIAYPCPIPVVCDADNKVGNPLFSGATMTCTAVTTDGDDDCQKTKTVTITGPGDSPCVQVGCFPGEDCAFCSDGITCTEDICDDSTGAPVCPNAPRPAGSDCSSDFGGAQAECDGNGVCELLGCTGDVDCPAPDGNCLGQSTCQGDLTCSTPPPVNEGGTCDNSGVGSGAGTCDAGTCNSADACGIPGAPACPDADECNLGSCDTSGAPYVCEIDPDLANGDSCNNGAGVCQGGLCVLPPIVSQCGGSQTSSIGCLVTGTLEVPLEVAVDVGINVPAAGADVQVEYFLSAVNPTFVLAGVAADTTILGLSLNTAVTDGTPAVISAQNEATVPDQELSAFLALPTPPLPPATANEIILAVNPVDADGNPITNVCGQVANSACEQGPIPPGIDLAEERVVPSSAATPTTYGWNGEVELTISALGGALILEVNTADPDICGPACAPGTPNEGSCAPLVQGPVVSCDSESQ